MRKSSPADFWKRVDVCIPGGCWEWLGPVRNGYGCLRFRGTIWASHRLAYCLHYGDIPDGLMIRHRCDNRRCCNPLHLEPGTHLQNMQDRSSRNRTARVYGERNWNSKLTNEQVAHIRANPDGKLQRELAAEFGITQNMVSKLQLRQAWKHM